MSGRHRVSLPNAAPTDTHTHTEVLVYSGGRKARSEICKQSLVGERLQGPRVLCLRGCRAGSSPVAQDVLLGQGEGSTARLGVASQGGSLRGSPCPARCCMGLGGAVAVALLPANRQPLPRGMLGRARGCSSHLLSRLESAVVRRTPASVAC